MAGVARNLGLIDMENLKVRRNFDPRKLIPLIIRFLDELGIKDIDMQGVVANLDCVRVQLEKLYWYCRDGLTLTSLGLRCKVQKNVADSVLQLLMHRFAERNPGGTLVLFTNDGGFASHASAALEMGVKVVLISRRNLAHKKLVKLQEHDNFRLFDFEDIIDREHELVFPSIPFFGNWGPGCCGSNGADGLITAWTGNSRHKIHDQNRLMVIAPTKRRSRM